MQLQEILIIHSLP